MEDPLGAFKQPGKVQLAQVAFDEGEPGPAAQAGEVALLLGARIVVCEDIDADDGMPTGKQGFAQV